MADKDFAVKGDILYAKTQNEILCKPDAYIICRNGICEGVFDELPEKWRGIKLYDYTGQLIMPGMTDLHVHAPQYTFRGLGMDLELLEWLQVHTFPEEAKYQDIIYARQAYSYFTEDLKNSFTTIWIEMARMNCAKKVQRNLQKTRKYGWMNLQNVPMQGQCRF